MKFFHQYNLSPNIDILSKHESSFWTQTGLSVAEDLGFTNMLQEWQVFNVFIKNFIYNTLEWLSYILS